MNSHATPPDDHRVVKLELADGRHIAGRGHAAQKPEAFDQRGLRAFPRGCYGRDETGGASAAYCYVIAADDGRCFLDRDCTHDWLPFSAEPL